ncbi:MAG: patatin-like phospholipase family protein [Pseudomonadota bacterium]
MLLIPALCGDVEACDSPQSGRPQVGLALSGGGSKAGAHIGVLRALEAQRIPIDCIAGTSAGAIIGSLYASGLAPQQIEAVVAGIDWSRILDDKPDRAELPFRRKRDSFSYLVKYRPGFKEGRLAIPTGLVQGQEVVQFLRRQYGPINETEDFSALPTPIRIVATDLETGDAVIIDRGDLAIAVRASMSVPVFFAPVERDGRLLVDGGPANNLPIDVVRAMGADIVIAVDITSPLLDNDELDSALTIADQLTNLLTQRNVITQLASLESQDILIAPELAGVGGLDFEQTLASVQSGIDATNRARRKLAPLSMSPPDYQAYLAGRMQPSTTNSYKIARVEIRNGSGVSDTLIASRLGISAGDVVDSKAIESGMANIYGLELFQSVDYLLIPDANGAVLQLDVRPRPWGPDYLQFGLILSEDFSVGSDFNVGIAYLRTAVNELGGEWRAQLDLGELQGISFDWYQPISTRQRHFVQVESQIARRSFQFFDDGRLAANLRVEGWGTRLSLGTELGTNAEFRIGWNHFDGDARATVGVLPVSDRSVDVGEYFTSFQYDTLDNVSFPRSGLAGGIGAFWSREDAGGKSKFEQLVGASTWAKSIGEYTMLVGVEAGTTLDNNAPLESQFLLGGLGRLSGYSRNRFAGQHFALASLTGFRRLYKSRWAPTYAGLSVEAGNVWDDRDDIGRETLRFAGAIFVGSDTALGPVYLAWGFAEGGQDTVYLTLGNPYVVGGARPLD